jgi:hypothetical protein
MQLSEYEDHVDLGRQDSFRQNTVDWSKSNVFDAQGVLTNDVITFREKIPNAINDSYKLLIKGKLVNAASGADLANGRYQLMNSAAVFDAISVSRGSDVKEKAHNPAAVYALSTFVKKSAVEIERDGLEEAFCPWVSDQKSVVVPATTNIYNPSQSVTVYNTGTIAIAGNAVTGTGTTFTAAMVGSLLSYSVAGVQYYALITARASDTAITIAEGPIDAAGGTAYTISTITKSPLPSNPQFELGSSLGVASSTNASGEFWMTLHLSKVLGSLQTKKVIPFDDIEFNLTKAPNGNRGIVKVGNAAVDAKFVFSDIKLIVDTIKPRPSIEKAWLISFAKGEKFNLRQRRMGSMWLTSASSDRVNIDLAIGGMRVLDLFILPQAYGQNDTDQTKNHIQSGNVGDWSFCQLRAGTTTFPRNNAYRGSTLNYDPEYTDLRRACDFHDSEGGCFIDRDVWDKYKWLYFNLAERSDDEMVSSDNSIRLEMTFKSVQARAFQVVYFYEVSEDYSIESNRMNKVSSYIV